MPVIPLAGLWLRELDKMSSVAWADWESTARLA
jgi:hypothetical protein